MHCIRCRSTMNCFCQLISIWNRWVLRRGICFHLESNGVFLYLARPKLDRINILIYIFIPGGPIDAVRRSSAENLRQNVAFSTLCSFSVLFPRILSKSCKRFVGVAVSQSILRKFHIGEIENYFPEFSNIAKIGWIDISG